MKKKYLINILNYVPIANNQKLIVFGVKIAILKDFNKWTSGNEHIDKFIQDASIKSKKQVEWIPYNRLRNIQFLAKGGFSTIYKAIWLDGYIRYWDSENKHWQRYSGSLENEDYENLDENEKKDSMLF